MTGMVGQASVATNRATKQRTTCYWHNSLLLSAWAKTEYTLCSRHREAECCTYVSLHKTLDSVFVELCCPANSDRNKKRTVLFYTNSIAKNRDRTL